MYRTTTRDQPREQSRDQPRDQRKQRPVKPLAKPSDSRVKPRRVSTTPTNNPVPTLEQITHLIQNLVISPNVDQPVVQTYDPENWSILDQHDQHAIRKAVYHTPMMDLCIRRILQVTGLPDTASVVSFIGYCIRRKYNTPILP
jgi:hypothetical protein